MMLELLESRRLRLILTALLHLGASRDPIPGKQLAEKLCCSRRYLEPDLQALSQAGILESRRGAHGGYRLARNAQRISLLDVLHGLGPDHPASEDVDSQLEKRITVPALDDARHRLDAVLAEITVAEWLARAHDEGLLAAAGSPADFCI
jgi:Rrf2 family protein